MTVHRFFCILHFCHTCSLCRVELVVQFPARGSTQVLLCLFPGVLWLWHFLHSVGPHPVSSLYIYTFVVSRAFMAGAASQAGDADSSRAPGLNSGFQGSVNVHRGALLLVPQWRCIGSFVFYKSFDDHNFNKSFTKWHLAIWTKVDRGFLTPWFKISKVSPLLHVKFGIDWAKTVVFIMQTRCNRHIAKVYLECWPCDPKKQ